MEFGYNNTKVSPKLMNFIFKVIQKIALKKKKRLYKINSYHRSKNEYYITFYAPGSRLTITKSAKEIMQTNEFISFFNHFDCFLIGVCASNPTIKLEQLYLEEK